MRPRPVVDRRPRLVGPAARRCRATRRRRSSRPSSTWPASSCSPARCSRSSARRPPIRRCRRSSRRSSPTRSATPRSPRGSPSTTTSTTTATYTESPSLTAFRPHFLALVENTSPEIANAYITSGELILDVALLRSLDDYVADEMSHARDAPHQPRRVAPHRDRLPHDRALLLRRVPRGDPRRGRARRCARSRAACAALATMMWHAKPFLQQVFLAPMDRTDPSGRRIQEAFKRIQLVLRKPTVARTPFSRFMIAAAGALQPPDRRQAARPVLLRALGAEDRAAPDPVHEGRARAHPADELRRARRRSARREVRTQLADPINSSERINGSGPRARRARPPASRRPAPRRPGSRCGATR